MLVLNCGHKGLLGLGFLSLKRVLKRIGDLNYIVSTPDRRLKARLCQAYEGHVMTVRCAMLAQMDVAQVEGCEHFAARLCNNEACKVFEEQSLPLTEL